MPAANKTMPINKAISKRRVLGSSMFWIPVLACVSAQRPNGAAADIPVVSSVLSLHCRTQPVLPEA
jgi:hypothetical protein